MEVKKFVFCVLFFTHAINLAEEDDSDKKKFSISTVKKDSSINKNNWNTRKWGNLYFLFPHLSVSNISKITVPRSVFRKLKNKWGILFNFLLSGVIEYKYMFHKKLGINIKLVLNDINTIFGKLYYQPIKQKKDETDNSDVPYIDAEPITDEPSCSFFSLDFSLEWLYKREGKKIYSGSFCPISISKLKVELLGHKNYDYLFWGFTLLKFEYNRCFYLNLGKIKSRWSFFGDDKENTDNLIKKNLRIIFDFLSIEFGLNIIGVNDWIKRKENFEI